MPVVPLGAAAARIQPISQHVHRRPTAAWNGHAGIVDFNSMTLTVEDSRSSVCGIAGAHHLVERCPLVWRERTRGQQDAHPIKCMAIHTLERLPLLHQLGALSQGICCGRYCRSRISARCLECCRALFELVGSQRISGSMGKSGFQLLYQQNSGAGESGHTFAAGWLCRILHVKGFT